jgi:hypothetical protein
MLIARADGADGEVVLLLGISDGNIQRLRKGQPMRISRASHGEVVPPLLTIAIMTGASESVIADELRRVGILTADSQVQIGGERLGATGQFPYGKADPTDEGELKMALSADRQQGIVRLEFGKPTAWLGLPVRQARELAETLLEKAKEVEKAHA